MLISLNCLIHVCKIIKVFFFSQVIFHSISMFILLDVCDMSGRCFKSLNNCLTNLWNFCSKLKVTIFIKLGIFLKYVQAKSDWNTPNYLLFYYIVKKQNKAKPKIVHTHIIWQLYIIIRIYMNNAYLIKVIIHYKVLLFFKK